jgi:hypothetical protein
MPRPLKDRDDQVTDALKALADYNKLLEDKVAKFEIQSVRSLAAIKEPSLMSVDDAYVEKRHKRKLRKLLHMQQVCYLISSFHIDIANKGWKPDCSSES